MNSLRHYLHSSRIVLTAIVCVALAGPQAAAEAPGDKLVTVIDGTLPIILTAPHGGVEEVPGVELRRGENIPRFRIVTDTCTDRVTLRAAERIEQELAGRPYVVAAKFARRYIDANRPPEHAFETDAAQAYYEAYHAAIQRACRRVQDHWGRGVLLDIHGQGVTPAAIYRGTDDGATTRHLLARFGMPALTGADGVYGFMEARGYPVIPASDSADREYRALNGGYTVRTYGSGPGGAIDAMQVELGLELRSPDRWQRTADDLADAIVAFARAYLPLAGANRPRVAAAAQ